MSENGPNLSGAAAATAASLIARCRLARTFIFQNGRANRNMLWMVFRTPSRAFSAKAFLSLGSGIAAMRSHSLARFLLRPISLR